MNSDVSSYKKLGETLTSASALVGTARTAAEQVAKILNQIQEKVVQAEDADAGRRQAAQADVTALTDTITSIATVGAVQRHQPRQRRFRRTRRHRGGDPRRRGAPTAENFDRRRSGPRDARRRADADIGTDDSLDAVDTLIDTANAAAAAFGAAQTRIEAQNEFLAKQADALKTGVGAMVDADMEEASARLAALQTQQQLGIQALSIANQAPQNVLSLFR